MHPDHTPDTPQFKQCTKCKEWKTLDSFARDKSTSTGYKFACKDCTRKPPKYEFPALPNGYKQCTRCKTAKPFEAFDRNSCHPTGYRSACKDCLSASGARQVRRPMVEGQKYCPRCQKYKPATTDYFDICKARGLQAYCKACAQEVNRTYRRENAERIAARKRITRAATKTECATYARRYKAAHKDRIRQINRRWYEKHKGERAIHLRSYYVKNKDAFLVYARRRRARKNAAQGQHTLRDVERQYKAQKGLCYYCGVNVGETYHIDHVVPLSRGGSDGPENLVVSCPQCNLSKKDKLPHEWPQGNRLL